MSIRNRTRRGHSFRCTIASVGQGYCPIGPAGSARARKATAERVDQTQRPCGRPRKDSAATQETAEKGKATSALSGQKKPAAGQAEQAEGQGRLTALRARQAPLTPAACSAAAPACEGHRRGKTRRQRARRRLARGEPSTSWRPSSLKASLSSSTTRRGASSRPSSSCRCGRRGGYGEPSWRAGFAF
jgi:hypothetical protein